MGSLALALNSLEVFKGENAVVPKDRELAINDETGDIYVFKQLPDGSIQAFSRTAQIQKRLDELEAAGVFTSAAAFVSNRKINRFYYDEDNGVVRLDPDLSYDPICRYYAIRSISAKDDGTYDYITMVPGNDEVTGDVRAALVNMTLTDSETGDGSQISVPEVGALSSDVVMTDGYSYMVEFYNADLNLVDLQAFQAIKVRTASKDLCPDTAVTDMIVQTNQQEDDNTVFLYQGQSIDELEFDVSLKYADGRKRDISSENVIGGHLIIRGIDEIDTSVITATGDTPQQIKVVYQMVRGNTSYSSNSSYETASKAVINPANDTIIKTLDVTIRADIHNDLERLIPVAWVAWDEQSAQYKVRIKYFGHYSNGLVNDITAITTGGDITGLDWGNTRQMTVRVPIGNANQYKNFNFSLTLPSNPSGGGASYSLRCKISTVPTRAITYDPSDNAAGQYSGKITGYWVSTTDTSTTTQVTGSDLLSSEEAKFNNKIPTHIRIRDVEDPSFLYTSPIDPTSAAYYRENTNHKLTRDRPLLVEYLYIEVDGQNATSVFVTGASLHYASPVAS